MFWSTTLALQLFIRFYMYRRFTSEIVLIVNIHDQCRVWTNWFNFQFVNELVPFDRFSAYLMSHWWFTFYLELKFIFHLCYIIYRYFVFLEFHFYVSLVFFCHSRILILRFTGVVLSFWHSIFMFHWYCFVSLELYLYCFTWVIFAI